MGRFPRGDTLLVALAPLPLVVRLVPPEGPRSAFRLAETVFDGLTVIDNGIEAVDWPSESFICERRALSCFIWTCLKCVSKSCQRMSSARRIVDLAGMLVAEEALEL